MAEGKTSFPWEWQPQEKEVFTRIPKQGYPSAEEQLPPSGVGFSL